MDDALYLRQRLVLVAGIGLTDYAHRCVDARYQRGTVGHVVVATAKLLLERSAKSHCVYARYNRAGAGNRLAQIRHRTAVLHNSLSASSGRPIPSPIPVAAPVT